MPITVKLMPVEVRDYVAVTIYETMFVDENGNASNTLAVHNVTHEMTILQEDDEEDFLFPSERSPTTPNKETDDE